MFFMGLDVNRLGWPTEAVNRKQWESDEQLKSDEEIDEKLESDEEIKFEEIDDVRTIFFLLCEALEEFNLVRFRVKGFGNSPWPVDVSTDLMTVLEQLDALLKFLEPSESSTGYLDFYEQGIQRQLVFTKVGDLIKINCHKLVDYSGITEKPWGQDIEEEPIHPTSLKLMICDLIKSLVSIANEVCTTLTSHELFQEWCREKYIADCLQS